MCTCTYASPAPPPVIHVATSSSFAFPPARVEVTEVDLGLDSGAFSSNLSPNKGMDADDVGMLSSAQA